MFREAIEYPGFSFVHVLAACVTYQAPGYAQQLFDKTAMLPEDHDRTDFLRAVEMARSEKFMLGVLYQREVAATTA